MYHGLKSSATINNIMKLKTLFGCIAAYILLLFRHGYVFGSGDQSEMLPYAKYLTDNTLYTKDFYVQSIAAFVPNERFVFSKSLSFFINYLPEFTFAIHAIATIALILGLHKLAQKWLTTEGVRWIAALAPIFILYNINLGGNELYYNTLTPSYLAQVVGLWAFILIFEGYMDYSYSLIFLSTFIHPLIGVQLWLLVFLTHIISKFKDKAYESWHTIILINLGYLLTAGFYIFKIKSGYDAGNISSEMFLDIIEFRAPHHYFPNYFPIKSWLILMPLMAIYFFMAKPLLRLVIGVILTGCVVYSFGVLVLKSSTIMSIQWFSMTIWLKTFSIMAFIGLIETFILDKKYLEKVFNSNLILNNLIVFSLISIVFMTPQYQLFKNKNYDFNINQLIKTPEINSALKAKELTPKDALFLIPSDLSSFRYWSERSIFIDYKAINHRQAALSEWYKRIQNVYRINLDDRFRNADLPYVANENFKQLKENDFLQFAKNQGITHVLTFKNCILNFPKIAENELYIIYKIQ
jgi:hypothetical protein